MSGSVGIFAKVIANGDVAKLFDMMEKGQVDPVKYLPLIAEEMMNIAREGGALEMRMKSLSAQQGRFSNAWTKFIEVMKDAGFEKGQAKIFESMADSLHGNIGLAERLGRAWSDKVAPAVSAAVGMVDTLTGAVADNPVFFSTLALIASSFLRIAAAVGAVFSVAEDVYLYFNDENAITVTGKLADKFESIRSVLEKIKELKIWMDDNEKTVDRVSRGGLLDVLSEKLKTRSLELSDKSDGGVLAGSGVISRTQSGGISAAGADRWMNPQMSWGEMQSKPYFDKSSSVIEATFNIDVNGETTTVKRTFDLGMYNNNQFYIQNPSTQ